MAENAEWQDERPGVDLAYGLMQSSYDSIMNRLNAVESRIQAVMVFSASFFFTAPILVTTSESDITLNSAIFYLAGLAALLNLIIGTLTRAFGKLKLARVYGDVQEWFDLPEYWFKVYAVEEAATHYRINVKTVNRKGNIAIAMTGVFIVEIVFLASWVFSNWV